MVVARCGARRAAGHGFRRSRTTAALIEGGDIRREQDGLLGRREMAAAGHVGPAADVEEPLRPLPRRYALADEVVVKERDGRRNRYEIRHHLPLPEAEGRERTIGELLELLATAEPEAKERT